jgi:Dimerisation domain
MPEFDPSHIMQVGMGFFGSKALLSAVELGLFTELAKRRMTASEIAKILDLHPRAVPDFRMPSWLDRWRDKSSLGGHAFSSAEPYFQWSADRHQPG